MREKVVRVSGIVIGLNVFFFCLICPLTILVVDWVFFGIEHQLWLSQDPRRFDFTGYETAEELREALLVRLPVGSSEEEVRAFLIANGEFFREPYRELRMDSWGKYYSTVMHQWKGNFSISRLFISFVYPDIGGIWIILFDLDPDDHTLVDISVKYNPGP